MKTTTHISIDTNLRELLKKLDLNISKEFESFIRFKLGIMTNNTDESELEIKKEELKKAETQNGENIVKIQSLKEQLSLIEQQIEKRKLEALIAQKKAEEDAKKCAVCNNIIQERMKFVVISHTKGLRAHSSCFTANIDKIQKLLNEVNRI